MNSGFLFRTDELVGKLPSRIKVQSRLSLTNALGFELGEIPETEVIQRFQRAINQATLNATNDLKIALAAALKNKVWSTVKGVDDIYDTGELLQSGSVTITGDTINISYDAPYAALVHYGGYINPYGNTTAKVYLPPRPWVESVLNGGGPVEQFDFGSYYLAELQKEFR